MGPYWASQQKTIDVAVGSKCEELNANTSSPLYPNEQTSMKGNATSHKGQQPTSDAWSLRPRQCANRGASGSRQARPLWL
jgi:hypothetical protein